MISEVHAWRLHVDLPCSCGPQQRASSPPPVSSWPPPRPSSAPPLFSGVPDPQNWHISSRAYCPPGWARPSAPHHPHLQAEQKTQGTQLALIAVDNGTVIVWQFHVALENEAVFGQCFPLKGYFDLSFAMLIHFLAESWMRRLAQIVLAGEFCYLYIKQQLFCLWPHN